MNSLPNYFTDDKKRVRKIDESGGRPDSKSMKGGHGHTEGNHESFGKERLESSIVIPLNEKSHLWDDDGFEGRLDVLRYLHIDANSKNGKIFMHTAFSELPKHLRIEITKLENKKKEDEKESKKINEERWDNLSKKEKEEYFGDWYQYHSDDERKFAKYNYGDVKYEKLPEQFKKRLSQGKYGGINIEHWETLKKQNKERMSKISPASRAAVWKAMGGEKDIDSLNFEDSRKLWMEHGKYPYADLRFVR